jgi:hypothetical protein
MAHGGGWQSPKRRTVQGHPHEYSRAPAPLLSIETRVASDPLLQTMRTPTSFGLSGRFYSRISYSIQRYRRGGSLLL